VLVVTWNNAADITACLDAALAQRDVALEVVLVENASSDGTRDVLLSRDPDPRVHLLLQDNNLGYADGNSLAAQQAQGRFLLLLNPDCEMDPSCVRTLLDHLENTPGAGAAAALLAYPDGRPQSFLRRDVSPGVAVWGFLETGKLFDARFLQGRKLKHRLYGEVDLTSLAKPIDVDCPAAACVLLPRALAGAPLFDPQFPLFFNDADLYRRLRDRAYTVQLDTEARAVHHYGTSVGAVPAARLRSEMVMSLRRYVRSRWSLAMRLVLWWLLLVDAAICLLRKGSRDRGRGTLGGLGLPGGTKPWLSCPRPRRGVRRSIKESARRTLAVTSRRWRRRRFLRRR